VIFLEVNSLATKTQSHQRTEKMLACGLGSLWTKAKSKGATFFGKIDFMKVF
jgi:hypothetical protein